MLTDLRTAVNQVDPRTACIPLPCSLASPSLFAAAAADNDDDDDDDVRCNVKTVITL